MYGWSGTILRVDLSQKKITKETTTEDLATNFLGGEGFGVKFLYDEVPAGTDPFDPKMIFVVTTGPLTGTLCPASGRLEVVTKSPLTGILGDSNAGGFFTPELKWAGYDAVIIQGKAAKPVYLVICDDEVEIRDAAHLWGKENKFEVQDRIKEEIGDPTFQIMDIGIAGENKVTTAAFFASGVRAGGMSGIGSVMGSKNLKAIAARGTKGVKIADLEGFKNVVEKIHEKIKKGPAFAGFAKAGTLGIIQDIYNEMGILPTHNYQESWVPPDKFEPISGATWMEKYKVKDLACFGCTVHCGHFTRVKEGPYAGSAMEGIELYASYAFGQNLGVFDWGFVTKAMILCNELGLSCTVGHLLGFAAELYQRKIISKEETDGLDLTWGNQEAFLALIRKIALRDGFGDILAEGYDQSAAKIGKGADRYLNTIKGMTCGEDLRWRIGIALAHVTSTRGGDHLKGMPVIECIEGMIPELREKLAKEVFGIPTLDPDSAEGKEKLVRWYENLCIVCDSVGNCKFNTAYLLGLEGGLNFEDYAKMLTTATGIEYDAEKLMKTAERIHRMERAYNAREGMRREHFRLPKRATDDPIPYGPRKGAVMDPKIIDKLLDSYFQLRGIDPVTALPTRKGLEEVDLQDVADDLEKRSLLGK